MYLNNLPCCKIFRPSLAGAGAGERLGAGPHEEKAALKQTQTYANAPPVVTVQEIRIPSMLRMLCEFRKDALAGRLCLQKNIQYGNMRIEVGCGRSTPTNASPPPLHPRIQQWGERERLHSMRSTMNVTRIDLLLNP